MSYASLQSVLDQLKTANANGTVYSIDQLKTLIFSMSAGIKQDAKVTIFASGYIVQDTEGAIGYWQIDQTLNLVIG